ncbi:hypothetical protein C4565_05640 [Candidatus Parcubacteria bacterium]|nr:MAG: hypothetical protein C4565_05640 [Candidatus Parcubacteria bacterium]
MILSYISKTDLKGKICDYRMELFIILGSILFRLAFFLIIQPWDQEILVDKIMIGDASGYHKLALELLKNKSLDSSYSQFRTPGYPFLIAAIYLIFGLKPWVVLLFQIFLNTGAVALIFKLCDLLLGEKSTNNAAILAAALFAFDPVIIFYSLTLLAETVFSFVFTLSIVLLLFGIKNERLTLIGISGLVLGLATLVKPISQYLPIIIAPALIFWIKNKKYLLIKSIVLFSLAFYTTIAPWALRNYIKYDQLKLTSFKGYNLLYYNATALKSYITGQPFNSIRRSFDQIAIQEGSIDTEPSFNNNRVFNEIAVNYLSENWIKYILLHIRGMLIVFLDVGVIGIADYLDMPVQHFYVEFISKCKSIPEMIEVFFKSKPISELFISIPMVVYLLIIYSSFFIGSYFLIKKDKHKSLLLVSLVILYFVALPGVIGQARYRVPIVPFYTLVSSYGIVEIIRRYKLSLKSKLIKITD